MDPHTPAPTPSSPTPPLLGPRRMGAVNWLGFWTLTSREIRRFLKVHFQTIWAPVVTTLLFLAVFTLALGGGDAPAVGDIPYLEFLAPGLVMMAMMQNAFANTSSSIIISKVQGNIVDTLMPPLSAGEILLGWALGGVVRGLVVGLVCSLIIALFVPLPVHHPLAIVFYGTAASLMLALLGMAGGIWADKFDHMAAVTNFVITPLSFLSGTFYSVERLPELGRILAHLNPFFYMIDGFRWGFVGHADSNLMAGSLLVAATDVLLLAVCYRMLKTGYKLKA